ncbi:sensor histidine kinase N-terminal domain-containing protein [Variovorax sp. CT11-76]
MDPHAPAPSPSPTDSWRFGIRARLLALLLPGMVALLALDSWSDYQALTESLVDAYDQSLLEPVQALANGIVVASDGSVRVQEAFSVQAMFESTHLRYKYLHVGAAPVVRGETGTEQTLMGVPDLPAPPPRRGGPEGCVLYTSPSPRDTR